METTLLTPAELYKKMEGFSHDYFLVDVRHDRESFYAIPEDQILKYWLCYSGIVLNHIMDGDLEKAWEVIRSMPQEGQVRFARLGLSIVHPEITWKELVGIINYLKEINSPIWSVILTAGRPSVLNGLQDISRLGPFLEKNKDKFMEDLKMLYEGECVEFIWRLCLAEYKYQRNELLDAEVLVSRTIKEFDRTSERRLLFSSLYLQFKILFAQHKTVSVESFIKNLNDFSKEAGKAEFSLNIDAAHVLFLIYEGNLTVAAQWLENGAPDEFGDFNMLDIFRYLVKIRCYIITKKYAAVVALVERIRPLLEQGRRYMDLCELDLLLSVAFYRSGKKELAFECLERALKLVRRRKYYRLVADEGDAVFHILIDYVNEKGQTDFLMKLTQMTRDMAILYPLYLKPQFTGEATFTQMETDILRLLEQGKNKEEIGEYFFISINTVKYHLKKIFAKLDVNIATQAVWKARTLKII